MNVENYKLVDQKLIRLSCFLTVTIFLNYFFWSINSFSLLKYLNFYLLLFFVLYFLTSRNFNQYNYVRIIFISLLLLSLGSVTTDWDARSVWMFHAKRIFFDNSLYSGFDNYQPEMMNAYPLIAPALSATFAKIIGHWNEIFPKSTNLLLLLPALLIQSSFLKNYKLNLIWLMFILLFSGRILVNGRTDGLVAMYFVTNCILIFNLFLEKNLDYASKTDNKKSHRLFLLITGIFSGIILTLLKNEGLALMFLILFVTVFLKIVLKNKFKYEDFIFWILIFTPVIIWKILATYNGVYPRLMGFDMGLHIADTPKDLNLFERIYFRIKEIENLKLIFSYLVLNEKLIFSVLIFTFACFKKFKENKLILTFILMNVLSYYFLLYPIFLSTAFDFTVQLNSTAHRVLISIVLALTFFSVYIFQEKKN